MSFKCKYLFLNFSFQIYFFNDFKSNNFGVYVCTYVEINNNRKKQYIVYILLFNYLLLRTVILMLAKEVKIHR